MADHIIKLTEEQCRFNTECRQLYNSGHMKEAYEMALERYKQSPDQLFYKFMYAIMAGDYSFDESLRQEKRQELLGVAKELLKEVYFDPMMGRYEPIFVTAFKNEYFFSISYTKSSTTMAWKMSLMVSFAGIILCVLAPPKWRRRSLGLAIWKEPKSGRQKVWMPSMNLRRLTRIGITSTFVARKPWQFWVGEKRPQGFFGICTENKTKTPMRLR